MSDQEGVLGWNGLSPTRWFSLCVRGKRVAVNALHLGDGHLSLGDEDLDGRGGEADVEGGADGARLDTGGPDNERARGIFRDGEVCLAAQELHAALGGRVGNSDGGAAVEFEDGAVGEDDTFVAAGGRGVEGRGGVEAWPLPNTDRGERDGGGETERESCLLYTSDGCRRRG